MTKKNLEKKVEELESEVSQEIPIKKGLSWPDIMELLKYIFEPSEVDTKEAVERAKEWTEDVKGIEEIEV